jgi:hypothetical protein
MSLPQPGFYPNPGAAIHQDAVPDDAHSSGQGGFVNHEEFSHNNSNNLYGYGRPTLRKRVPEAYSYNSSHPSSNNSNDYGSSPHNSNSNSKLDKAVVKKLDFMFPKVDQEFTLTTDGGGAMSLAAYLLILVFVTAEILAWRSGNTATLDHIRVDTSLGQRMRVNLNITFPGLACEDLHVDVMDVAGDSQLNIDDTLVKLRMKHGAVVGTGEKAESNAHKKQQAEKERVLAKDLPENYCGPCYGAQEEDSSCCNSCDSVVEAYEKKRWRTDLIQFAAEQCLREGRDKKSPKRMKHGEGCNLHGHMIINRVAGNFHIAMGEGIERDGRHIHSFVPDDTANFNASHIIHHLSFGLPESEGESQEQATMDGLTKLLSKETGTTGLFQYFIKIVPTTYVGKGSQGGPLLTNRYFFTERFRPLNKDWYDDDDHFQEDWQDDDDDETAQDPDSPLPKKGSVSTNAKQGIGQHAHHHVRNAILPGIFFIYEIYPFSVEVEPVSVPLTHLLIRLMATIGGVWTCVKWLDSFVSKSGSRVDGRRPAGRGVR